MTITKIVSALFTAILFAAIPVDAQISIPLTITQSSSQVPGTLGTGTGSSNCPNTVINTSASFTVTLPSQYGSIAQALADGYFFVGTGVGSGSGTSYQNGDRCDPTPRSVGPETYSVRFDRSSLAIQGIPDNIGVGPVNPNGFWQVSPTAITYSGPYFQQMSGPAIGTMSFSINGNIGGLPDLSIVNIRITQAMLGSGVNDDLNGDLVVGKPAVARVQVGQVVGLPGDTSFTVRFEASGLQSQSQSRTVAQLQSQANVDFYFTPLTKGRLDVRAEVNPPDSSGKRSVAESDTNNNVWPRPGAGGTNSTVTVRRTSPLRVAFIKLDCDSPIDDQRFLADSVKGFNYTVAVFPVDPDASRSALVIDPRSNWNNARLCTPPPSNQNARSAYFSRLSNALTRIGQELGADRTVAWTTPTWLEVLKPKVAGWTPIMKQQGCGFSSIVMIDEWEVVAHELSHTFGIQDPGGEPDDCFLSPGTQATKGFWVEFKKEQLTKNPLMGPDPSGDNLGAIYPNNKMWPRRDDYERMLETMAILAGDPELLLIAGISHADGRIELEPVLRVARGFASTPQNGSMALRLADASGTTLLEVPFAVSFITTDPVSQVDTAPFALAVPYVPGTAAVEILHDGVPITKLSIPGTLLFDAINSFSQDSFTAPNRKGALLNQAKAFESQIGAGDDWGARQKLEQDIRKHVEDWLREDDGQALLPGYSKAQLLELIDSIVVGLANGR